MGRNIAAVITRIVSKKVDRMIVPTEKVQKLLRGYRVENPIDVIPSGINLERFFKPCSKEQMVAERNRLGIPLHHKLCVSVGRLAKEKNETELLQFFKKLAPKDCTYLIVGDGPYRENLEKLTRELGLEDQVIFRGMVQPKEVPLYYQMSDLFLCASSSEQSRRLPGKRDPERSQRLLLRRLRSVFGSLFPAAAGSGILRKAVGKRADQSQ